MNFKKYVPAFLVIGMVLLFVVSGSGGAQKELGRFVLEGIEFGQGSAVIKKSSLGALQPLLDELNADPHLSLVIEGHYDSSEPEEKNLKLARARAQVVFNWLTANGVDASRLTYEGHGSTQPVVDGKTPDARAKNSRIEIVKARDVFPAVSVPQKNFSFQPVVDGEKVTHDFVIRNTGTTPLHINNVRTG
jgi:hypothetical protein